MPGVSQRTLRNCPLRFLKAPGRNRGISLTLSLPLIGLLIAEEAGIRRRSLFRLQLYHSFQTIIKVLVFGAISRNGNGDSSTTQSGPRTDEYILQSKPELRGRIVAEEGAIADIAADGGE